MEDHADQKGPGLAFAGEFPEDQKHTRSDQRNNESGDPARRAGDFADPVGDLRDAEAHDEVQLGVEHPHGRIQDRENGHGHQPSRAGAHPTAAAISARPRPGRPDWFGPQRYRQRTWSPPC